MSTKSRCHHARSSRCRSRGARRTRRLIRSATDFKQSSLLQLTDQSQKVLGALLLGDVVLVDQRGDSLLERTSAAEEAPDPGAHLVEAEVDAAGQLEEDGLSAQLLEQRVLGDLDARRERQAHAHGGTLTEMVGAAKRSPRRPAPALEPWLVNQSCCSPSSARQAASRPRLGRP